MRLLLALSVFFFATGATASFLRLVSEFQLSLSEKQGALHLQGKLILENQGDEVAKEVIPEFSLDRWSLALPQKTIQPMEKVNWQIDVPIPEEKLCRRASKDCLLALPTRGDFRIRIDKNYQDQNGYAFSAPDILGLAFGKNNLGNSNSDEIQLDLKIVPEKNFVYRAEYVIRNPGDRPRKLALYYVVPKEVELSPSELPMEISAQGEVRGSFIFKNKTGLMDSEYLTLLVAEWVDHNERKFTWNPAMFRIQNFIEKESIGLWSLSAKQVFLFLWGLFSLSAIAWVYLYWQRKCSK